MKYMCCCSKYTWTQQIKWTGAVDYKGFITDSYITVRKAEWDLLDSLVLEPEQQVYSFSIWKLEGEKKTTVWSKAIIGGSLLACQTGGQH